MRALRGSRPTKRLVDHQHLGIVNQRGSEDHALLHPLRVGFAELVGIVAHLEGFDQLFDPLGRSVPIQPVHLHDELEEFPPGELVVKIRLVGNIAQQLPRLLARGVEAPDPHRSRIGRQQTRRSS